MEDPKLVLPDGSVVLGLEPLHGVRLGDPVAETNSALAPLPLRNTTTGAGPKISNHVSIQEFKQ